MSTGLSRASAGLTFDLGARNQETRLLVLQLNSQEAKPWSTGARRIAQVIRVFPRINGRPDRHESTLFIHTPCSEILGASQGSYCWRLPNVVRGFDFRSFLDGK